MQFPFTRRSPVLRTYVFTSAGLIIVALILWAVIDPSDLVLLIRAVLLALTGGGVAATIADFAVNGIPDTDAIRMKPVAPDRRTIVRRVVTSQATTPISEAEAEAGVVYAEALVDWDHAQSQQTMGSVVTLTPLFVNLILGSPGPLLTTLLVVTLLLLFITLLIGHRRRQRLLASSARFIESHRRPAVDGAGS